MPVQYAAGDVPVWQIVVSGELCAAATVWMAQVAAGIHARSILGTGSRIRLRRPGVTRFLNRGGVARVQHG
jgi:hypothetical protein